MIIVENDNIVVKQSLTHTHTRHLTNEEEMTNVVVVFAKEKQKNFVMIRLKE